MNRKINRKKISIRKQLIYLLLSLLSFTIVYFSYHYINKLDNLFISSLTKFSLKYNYNLNSYKINDLNNIEKNEIVKIIQPYLDKPIFLVPLKEISQSILENNWVEKVKINIDYQNTIFVEIVEFRPVGIYKFNDGTYYFNSKGKIIDYKNINSYNDELIIFSGQSSTLNASSLLNTINIIKKDFKSEILQADYVGKRRWDLLLKNGIIIKLSENKLNQSIENYLKLSNNFNNNDLTDIKVIDFRDASKAIIEYK